MASVLRIPLAFLHKLYSSPNHVKRFARRLALFLALLGPRFSVWLRSWHGESGTTRRKSTPIDPPSPCTTTSSCTVSRDSAGLRENIVACSTVPTSASVPSLQDPDHGTRQPTTGTPSGGASLLPGLDSFAVDHVPCLTSSPDGRIAANLSSTNLSVHYSASDGHHTIRHPLEPFHAQADQPSHLELGQGQDASQSREGQFKSSSTDLPRQYPHPDMEASNISSHTHVDDKTIQDPAVSPAVSTPSDPAEEPSQGHQLPRGDVLRLMTSEQVPRFTKNITMQVNNYILLFHTYTCRQMQRGDILRNSAFNENIPLVRLDLNVNPGSNRDLLASSNGTVLIKARLIRTVILGHQLSTPTVHSIFLIRRGCVHQPEGP